MKHLHAPLVRVAVNVPLERAFDYRVPRALATRVHIGARVRVPFGPRVVTGVVVGTTSRSAIPHLREVLAAVDDQPIFSAELLRLGRWVAERYYCSWGEALAAMAPPAGGRRGIVVPSQAPPPSTEALLPQWQASSQWQEARSEVQSAITDRRAQVWVVQLAPSIPAWDWLADVVRMSTDVDRPALVLVPERQQVEFLRARWQPLVGERSVFVHHAMGHAARRQAWGRILAGQVRLVVGTRLAVFAPLPACGVLMLMDEHDASFKQDDIPHYHAREILLERAKQLGAPALLASVTPSLEAWQMAQRHQAQWLRVAATARARPRIFLVDLRSYRAHRQGGGWPLISPPLERRLDAALQRKQRALLWLNRLGFATRIQCHQCGHVLQCDHCHAPLTFFSRQRALRCRYCDTTQPAPDRCPGCHQGYLRYQGRGIEKVASEVARHFPTASTRLLERGTAHPSDDWDVLVATDAALHGWGTFRVPLVGAIVADAALAMPDFRAAERLTQRLWRALQRLSSDSDDGVFVIQAINPEHPALVCVAQSDVERFYRQEMVVRRRHQLPPWTHVIQVIVRARRLHTAEQHATMLASALRHAQAGGRVIVLGPAPMQPARQRGQYQWQIVLKGASMRTLTQRLRRILEEGRRWRGESLTIDVDPL